ncbi:MAG: hypothetical protein NTV79_09465 [Candidatus Aureabacteria bacterium]|nr:hypothetical protein [Candidatus Auribacterota bacterium]
MSGRKSAALRRRARELWVREVYQGVKDKTAVFQALLRRHGLSLHEVACVGDDASDRDLLRAAGFAATPADGHPSLDAVTQYRSKTKGGEGAVMEIIDLILRTRSRSKSSFFPRPDQGLPRRSEIRNPKSETNSKF